MNEELKKALIQYKKCTLDLISNLEKEDYDSLDGILNIRQNIIDNLSNISHTKEEFTSISNELEILMLQNKLVELMSEKRNKVRNELEKINESKSASKLYNKKIYNNRSFFNTTI